MRKALKRIFRTLYGTKIGKSFSHPTLDVKYLTYVERRSIQVPYTTGDYRCLIFRFDSRNRNNRPFRELRQIMKLRKKLFINNGERTRINLEIWGNPSSWERYYQKIPITVRIRLFAFSDGNIQGSLYERHNSIGIAIDGSKIRRRISTREEFWNISNF